MIRFCRILKSNLDPSSYSVMQSGWDSFCEDVALDYFNMASRDENRILDQIKENKYVRIFIMKILIFSNTLRKCILT